MSDPLDPLALISQPATEATAERLADGDFLIRWAPDATAVTIYTGSSPETIDLTTPILTNHGNDYEALISGLDPTQRPYFVLHFAGGPADGRSLMVAERILQLEGGVNFRDIGGYATSNGRTTRWGQLYRTGTLADLTDEDSAYLEQLDIRLDCDLRTDNEVAEQPDRLPPGTTYWHLPVGGSVSPIRRTFTLLRKRHRLREVLEEAYTRVMLDQNGPLFGELFRKLAEPDSLPMIVHCTAGKDRTGVAMAILLSVLGVDDETIAADYSLSNYYYDAFVAQMTDDLRRLVSIGFNDNQVQPFLLAEQVTVLGLLAYVRDTYGSAESYVQQMGSITPDELHSVRNNLLT